MTCSFTSFSFFLRILITLCNFTSLFDHVPSWLSQLLFCIPLWLSHISSLLDLTQHPLSSLLVSDLHFPNPSNSCPSVLLSVTAHPFKIFSSLFLSFLTPSLSLHASVAILPSPLPSLFTPSLRSPTVHHSLPSCLCQSQLPGIHLEEVLLSDLDNTSPTLSCFTHNPYPACMEYKI